MQTLGYLQLLLAFFKIGFISFGGIYSVWALAEEQFVPRAINKSGIESEEGSNPGSGTFSIEGSDLRAVMGISRLMPGPRISGVSILGFRAGGVPAMLVIIIGLCAPGMLLIPWLTRSYNLLSRYEWFLNFKNGAMLAVISILILFWLSLLSRGFSFYLAKSLPYFAIAAAVSIANYKWKVSPVLLVILSGIAGFFLL